jgi:hypothetical protein
MYFPKTDEEASCLSKLFLTISGVEGMKHTNVTYKRRRNDTGAKICRCKL